MITMKYFEQKYPDIALVEENLLESKSDDLSLGKRVEKYGSEFQHWFEYIACNYGGTL